MRSILFKLSLRLILCQLLVLYLFGNAFFRFYYFLNADLYECIRRNIQVSAIPCLEPYSDISIAVGDLLTAPIYFMLYGYGFAVMLIIVVNMIRKKSFWNSLLVILLYILLLWIHAFSERYLDTFCVWFGQLFSHKIWVYSLISSITTFLLGSLLLWLSVKTKNDSIE